jgi:asparagine synthase (glutamine-hydrolysing)
MCGIVGTLYFDGSAGRVSRERLHAMRDRMEHRGPDGAGSWISSDGAVGLGHRRLSIIDLSSAADQPMSAAHERLQIVFNGEIYNHAEIRAELTAAGVSDWKTDHSDTEVILRAYERWGFDCVHRFRGMFAFALWDGRSRELWLVRDRIGIKPLYYSVHHGRISFASEIKALLADPEQQRRLNEESLFHFLTFITTPAPETLFEGIRKLAGGSWLRVKAGGDIQEQRYWDPWDQVTPMTDVSEKEITIRLLEELRTAVRYRKVSDVPMGVFLSGGIDSSTNAALFSEGENRPIKTFSIGYQGEYQSYKNEMEFARMMARQVGAEHHERLLTEDDLIEFLPRMVYLQDEPIADPVCVPVYYVSKLARDNGVIVCHVGEGADELFFGYPNWLRILRLQKMNELPVPDAVKKMALFGMRMAGKGYSKPYELLRRGAAGLPIFWSAADAFTEMHKFNLLAPRLKQKFQGRSSWEVLAPLRRRFEEKCWEPSHENWMSYADLNVRLPELLLMRVDKMSMGVSLEGRVPFLDHKFVEFALGIPSSMRVQPGEPKRLLKKAVRGVIPDALIDRPKQGFGVPVYEWFFSRLGAFARSEIERFCKEADILDHKAVLELFEQKRGEQAWFLLNLALWWREYVGGPAPSIEESVTTASRLP